MTSRDEFSQATKKTLSIRAAHFCSNPDCIKLTAGPHSDESKSLSTGHAAHIHAAAPNGPRYNPAQSSAERRAIANGLWLCRVCGDIVDKDAAPHSAELLRQWKRNHEAMIAGVRTKGYSQSLALIQTRRAAPALAKQVIAMLEDHRVFWASFDAEFPDRVRHSLDSVRSQLATWRGGLSDGSGLDQILLSLTKTIHVFFNEVEQSDLSTLRCNGNDPEWLQFRDALATLRKSIGFQIGNLAAAYDIALSADLKRITPMPAAH
jgi:hypothetical protein